MALEVLVPVLPVVLGVAAYRLYPKYQSALIAGTIGLFLSVGTLVGYWVNPTFRQWMLTTFEPEDTEEAAGFSEEAFERIRRGMTASEVEAELGEPLDKTELRGEDYCLYTRKVPGGDDFRVRTLIFDANGRVARIVSEFYVD